MLPVTALYAVLLTALFLLLTVRTIAARKRYHVLLGAPHRLVERAVRAHGNFAEYAPLALVLLGLLEANGLPPWALHALGTLLTIGRFLHALGIAREPENLRYRTLGMGFTLTMLGVAAAALAGLILP